MIFIRLLLNYCQIKYRIYDSILKICIKKSFFLLKTMTSGKVEINGWPIWYEKFGIGNDIILLIPGALGMFVMRSAVI